MSHIHKCPHCGAALQENAQFCPFCMQSLQEKKTVKVKEVKHYGWLIWLALSAVILIVSVIWLICFAWGSAANAGKISVDKRTDDAHSQQTKQTDQEIEQTDQETEQQPVGTGEAHQDRTDGNTGNLSSTSPPTEEAVPDTGAQTTGPATTATRPVTTTATTPSTTPTVATCSHTYRAATCAAPMICTKCGASYGSADTDAHDWQTITATVHHDEKGHYETVEDYVKKTYYRCFYCGYSQPGFETLDALCEHMPVHSHYSTYEYTFSRPNYGSETYETWVPVYEEKWIVDQEAYDETMITGYQCRICGQTK